ncbi:MAG: YSC84-related protein [Sphingomonadales bacterium]
MAKTLRNTFITLIIVAFGSLALGADANAAKKEKIDQGVVETLEAFHNLVGNSEELLENAKGVLIFPSVKKAGIGVGGETGAGALQINGETVDYYRTAAATVGLQLGFQKRHQMLIFMTDESLQKFRDSANWEIGGEAAFALVTLDGSGNVNTQKINKPVIGFVFGATGLMYNLTLEGAKISKIYPD